MRFLYISSLASSSVLDQAFHINPHIFGYAAQKFNRLVVEGLLHNGHEVTVLSSFVFPKRSRHPNKKEVVDGIVYNYVSFADNSIIRHFKTLFSCFLSVFRFGIGSNKGKAIICDALSISSSIGALLAARITGLRCVGIVTDIPGMMIGSNHHTPFREKVATIVNTISLRHFSHYVLLTEAMNPIVNPKGRPYIVLEGMVDVKIHCLPSSYKGLKRIVLYAGGLYERYGLKTLVEAFHRIDNPNLELWLYGEGDYVSDILDYSKQDNRIVYKGICSNDEVVDAERMATLLVNPRPTNEDFTQYSFPSKNMEYMVSGTPLLTTVLPGMPKEYYPYVFLFDQGESISGYYSVLDYVLSLPEEMLYAKGRNGMEWILKKKNNDCQAARIVDLVLS